VRRSERSACCEWMVLQWLTYMLIGRQSLPELERCARCCAAVQAAIDREASDACADHGSGRTCLLGACTM
jgi:hypothetical protein